MYHFFPLAILASMFTSSAVEVAPAVYNPATNYALNATSSVAGPAGTGLITVYKSLQASNAGHSPASSPAWWVSIGTTYQVYSGAQAYVVGEYVIDPTAHLVYKCVVAGTGNALTDATKWQEISYTNPWAMFDYKRGTRTIVPDSLTLTLTPGTRIDSLMLGKMVAAGATLTQTVGGSPVYSKTYNLVLRNAYNGYQYCFNPFYYRSTVTQFDIPPVSSGVLTITFTATPGSNVEVGICAVGIKTWLGEAEIGAVSPGKNYSTVTRNIDGTLNQMVQRPNVPGGEVTTFLDKAYLPPIYRVRDAAGGVPSVFAVLGGDIDNEFDELFTWMGFPTRFDIKAPESGQASVSLAIEAI